MNEGMYTNGHPSQKNPDLKKYKKFRNAENRLT